MTEFLAVLGGDELKGVLAGGQIDQCGVVHAGADLRELKGGRAN